MKVGNKKWPNRLTQCKIRCSITPIYADNTSHDIYHHEIILKHLVNSLYRYMASETILEQFLTRPDQTPNLTHEVASVHNPPLHSTHAVETHTLYIYQSIEWLRYAIDALARQI